MMTPIPKPPHPGAYIREKVLPESLAVKRAAEILGVGRPALSNLLNGKASLTSEMALRLEKAFGANAEALLRMQSDYDQAQTREQAKEIAVRAYVPSFLEIEARQISAWSEQIRARAELPALLRRLITSTGGNLSLVDFPAYDNAQRKGWDGRVIADGATPWIPHGTSGWEFGCDRNAAQKAEDDYASRTASVSSEERASTTLVFVTPRNWPGKEKWATEKRKENSWKDVRALDASDLEQWLEQSAAAQAWISEKLGSGADGISTLDASWKEWAEVTTPPLRKNLFQGALRAHQGTLGEWLSKPPTQPLVIAADSEGEALAFLVCALETIGVVPGEFYDRALVLHSVDALKRVVSASLPFIAVVTSPEVERASGGLHSTHHMVIIRRRNDVSSEPNITLDLLDAESFRSGIQAMGLSDEDSERYGRETGYSATILRRRLSHIPAIRAPAWSTSKSLARQLIPLNFAGVWSSTVKADQEILSLLTGEQYEAVERSVAELLKVVDAPVWSIGNVRGIVSKIDVLYATSGFITKDDLDRFFFTAQYVLSEKDPALDLPPDKRWAANIYGKTRDHSAALREGICETLVLLSVHGDALLGTRLGLNVEAHVNGIIKALLTPLDAQTWASQQHDLPRYAEAAPDVFLDILEMDLASPSPKVHELLRPADTGIFGSCPRTGLLWALEALAWKPERLTRVSAILAKLAEVRIDDNWSNKPEESLNSIFRSWMPQTAASLDEIATALETICKKFPSVGWRLCVSQFGSGNDVGHYNSRPHWRNDASGAGQPLKTRGEVFRLISNALRIALSWPNHNESTLGDLIERLERIAPKDQEEVWQLAKAWIATRPADNAMSVLRERVRRSALTRRARVRGVADQLRDQAREIYDLLLPQDMVTRHLWLFAQHWVEESAEELEDEGFDYQKRDKKIAELRKQALAEIWTQTGYGGVLRLCEQSNAENVIGWHLAEGVIPASDYADFVARLVAQSAPPSEVKVNNLLSGFIDRLGPDVRGRVISDVLRDFETNADIVVRMLKCAPFRKETWKHLEALDASLQARYWNETYVRWDRQEEDELNFLVDRLLEAKRPRAAFSVVHMTFDKIATPRLVRLLRAVATIDAEPAAHFKVAGHDISDAFFSLKERPDISSDELAQLEFLYVEALDHSKYGIPTLSRFISETPELFVNLIARVFKRREGGEDPPELRIDDKERASSVATAAYSALSKASRIPGTDEQGKLDENVLRTWITNVRGLCRTYGRERVGDHSIGELLAKSPPGKDGIWPREEIRNVLEEFPSQDLADGMSMALYNSRGATWRGEGGQQERDLAKKYRDWVKLVAFQWPFTAKLLERIASSYDHEATWHDNDDSVRRRLNH